MNVDRGKETFALEEIVDLRAKLDEYKRLNGYSWSTLAQKTGVAAGTVSQWVPGTYKGDNQAIAAKIHRFFLHQEAQDELERDAPIVPPFQPTPTSRRVMGTLSWSHRGKFVVIVGDPGAGKTAALDQYVATNPNCWKVTASPSKSRINAMLLALVQAQGAKGRQFGASATLAAMVRERVEHRRSLIVVDEAQHLASDALEELRAIHDETGVGLALCGNREVLTRVEGAARQAAFAQLYSRITLRLILPGPDPQDVDVLLAAWGVEAPKEREFLRNLALKAGGGGVRSLTATLEYATILAQQEAEEPRVLEHLKTAWTALSSRALAA